MDRREQTILDRLHRLSPGQARILYALATEPPGIGGTEIAKEAGLRTKGIFVMLKRLIELGVVEQGLVPNQPMRYSITKLGWDIHEAQRRFLALRKNPSCSS